MLMTHLKFFPHPRETIHIPPQFIKKQSQSCSLYCRAAVRWARYVGRERGRNGTKRAISRCSWSHL